MKSAAQDFYEDIFEELAKYGEIENLNVCDNLADHMVGSVYVKFADENGAAAALQAMQGRYYGGRPIQVGSCCRPYALCLCSEGLRRCLALLLCFACGVALAPQAMHGCQCEAYLSRGFVALPYLHWVGAFAVQTVQGGTLGTALLWPT